MSCTPDNEFQHGLLGPLSPQLRGPPSRSPTTAQRRFETCSNVSNAQKAAIHRRRGARVKLTEDGPRAVSPPHARWLARRKAKKLRDRAGPGRLRHPVALRGPKPPTSVTFEVVLQPWAAHACLAQT